MAPETTAATTLRLKLTHRNDSVYEFIHGEIGVDLLRTNIFDAFSKHFNLSPHVLGSLVHLQWKDNEGDWVRFTNNPSFWQHILEVACSSTSKLLHVRAIGPHLPRRSYSSPYPTIPLQSSETGTVLPTPSSVNVSVTQNEIKSDVLSTPTTENHHTIESLVHCNVTLVEHSKNLVNNSTVVIRPSPTESNGTTHPPKLNIMLATKPLEYDTDGRVRKWTRIVVKWFIRNNLLHEHFHTDIFSSQCPHHEHITCEAGSPSYFRRHKGNCVNFNLFLPRALQKDVLDLDIIIGEVVKEQFDGNEEDPKRMECIFGVVKKLVTSQIEYWDESRFEYPARASSYFSGDKKIDLMITLGGDGTILHAAWLFQTDVPPILPFYLGSLGFLTIFNPSDYSEIFEQHLLNDTPTNVTLRMRLSCRVVRQSSTLSLPDSSFSSLPPQQTCEPSQVDKSTQISFSSNSTGSTSSVEYEEINSYPSFSGGSTSHDKSNHLTSNPPFSDPIHILNEVVIERGASPHMVNLEVFVNGKYWTKISADGVVVATPTGSTAYSLSAGGSLVHPVQNAILITPICPHLLTGRPMILPSNLEIQIRFPCGRGQAWASFDSRHRTPLNGGDTLIITVSKYPVPTLCVNDSNEDWLSSLEKCLLWNERRDVAAVTAGNGNGVNGEQVKSVL